MAVFSWVRLLRAITYLGINFEDKWHYNTFLPHMAKEIRPPSSSPAGILFIALMSSPAIAHITNGLTDIWEPSLRTSPRNSFAMNRDDNQLSPNFILLFTKNHMHKMWVKTMNLNNKMSQWRSIWKELEMIQNLLIHTHF